jgi:hypothetical protein
MPQIKWQTSNIFQIDAQKGNFLTHTPHQLSKKMVSITYFSVHREIQLLLQDLGILFAISLQLTGKIGLTQL